MTEGFVVAKERSQLNFNIYYVATEEKTRHVRDDLVRGPRNVNCVRPSTKSISASSPFSQPNIVEQPPLLLRQIDHAHHYHNNILPDYHHNFRSSNRFIGHSRLFPNTF